MRVFRRTENKEFYYAAHDEMATRFRPPAGIDLEAIDVPGLAVEEFSRQVMELKGEQVGRFRVYRSDELPEEPTADNEYERIFTSEDDEVSITIRGEYR